MHNMQKCSKKEQTVNLHIETLYLLLTRKLSCVMYPGSSNTSLKLLASLHYFLACSMLTKQAILGLVYIKTSIHPPCLNQTGRFSGSDQITSISPPNMPPASSFSCPTASPILGDQVASCQQSPAAAHLEIHACSELPH